MSHFFSFILSHFHLSIFELQFSNFQQNPWNPFVYQTCALPFWLYADNGMLSREILSLKHSYTLRNFQKMHFPTLGTLNHEKIMWTLYLHYSKCIFVHLIDMPHFKPIKFSNSNHNASEFFYIRILLCGLVEK